jgi:hypothetical protein
VTRLSCIAVLSAAAAVASALAAQSVTPVGVAPRSPFPSATAREARTPPVIDGRLDDPAWTDAQPLTGFTQREPRVGEPATERTEVRIVTDAEALYVGAWLYDRSAAEIVPGEKIRDVPLQNSDYFAFILDTYHDRQNGFVFGTTPAGVEYDGQVTREGEGGGVFQQGQNRAQVGTMGGFNLNWDGSWTVATGRDSLGWYAEFRIPFTTLRYGAGTSQTWGLNAVRLIRRKNEDVFWSPIPRQHSLYRLSLAGTLEGVRVPSRRVATVTPYAIASSRRRWSAATTPPTATTTYPRDVGLDAKIGLTPSLTLDLTWNTDFAQVEVDDQRVNLTRFPLFFPEKRPFFLENAGAFSAGTPQAVELFFSRRIGIDAQGNALPILGGGRLSGRVGGTTVGILQMLTDREATLRGQSYTVARVVREAGRRSRVGAIGVQRLARDTSGDHNRTVGLDGRLGIGDDWTVDWWGARTETPGRGNDDLGFSTRVAYETDRWNNNVRYVQLGSDFSPELGFLNRAGGYRYYETMIQRQVRPRTRSWLRTWNPHVTYRGYFLLDGFRQSEWFHFDMTEVQLASGARFGPDANSYREGLQEPFEIAPGVSLPAGSYDWTILGWDWTTDPSAPLSMVLRAEYGPFYNGRRHASTVTLIGRRGATWSSSLLVDYNDVHLAQGNFVRSLVGARLAWFFTPRVSVQTLAQYNNQQRIWSSNTRFSWLSTAGTGLFVVFNDGEEADGFFRWTRPQTRTLTVKYTRQLGRGE